MKEMTYKIFVPQDPNIKLLLKRIVLIITVHLVLGALAAKFGAANPVLAFVGLLLCSSLLGIMHWLSFENPENPKKSFQQLGLTAALTVIAGLSLLIPLLLITPELSLLALSGICFGLANLIGVLVVFWMNQPVFVPEKAEVLDWFQAFLQTLIVSSPYYIIFKIRETGKQKIIGLPVDRVKLYEQKEITVQKLWSNWVWRYNEKVTKENLIATQFTRYHKHEGREADGQEEMKRVTAKNASPTPSAQDQTQECHYVFSFYRRRLFFFKKYLSPFAPFDELPCKWRYKLQRNDLQEWRIIRAVVIHVDRHEPAATHTSSNDFQS